MARFQKGAPSANPNGRPRGSKNAATILRDQIKGTIPAILDKLVAQALEGDTAAARLLLERTVPPVRSESMPVNIDIPPEAGLAERAEAVFSAAAKGEVTVDAATSLLQALGAVARIREVDELAARVTNIEEALANRLTLVGRS